MKRYLFRNFTLVFAITVFCAEGFASFPRPIPRHFYRSSLLWTATGNVVSDIEPNIDAIGEKDVTVYTYYNVPRKVGIRLSSYDLLLASLVGVSTGFSVAAFKLAIKMFQDASYGRSIFASCPASIPALGGLMVGALALFGPFRAGLRGTIEEVDEHSSGVRGKYSKRLNNHLGYIHKIAASVITLGSGCSLGPEGPCVEIGLGAAQNCIDIDRFHATSTNRKNWNRLLLSCGAAGGVAAGFNAPFAGVFFPLEVMQGLFDSIDNDEGHRAPDDALGSTTVAARTAPILLASVLSALCARTVLGSHLALQIGASYSLRKPLLELPLYVALGVASASVAFMLNSLTRLSRSFYEGNLGPPAVKSFMKRVPVFTKPLSAGLICSLLSLKFPHILFFGYALINPVLENTFVPTCHLMSVLFVKVFVTAICASSGLVGGIFAPSLFLGALTGASLHNMASAALSPSMLADLPAYAIVGAGSVLAAVFRAPLTACLMLFEVTRDYDVILPLMVSAGVGGRFIDALDCKASRIAQRIRKQNRSRK